jgi:hypothetical protein
MTWDDPAPFRWCISRMLALSESDRESFLIVSAGDVFIQLAARCMARTIHCEAVSGRFLPAHVGFRGEHARALTALGFGPPVAPGIKGCPNFYRPVEMTNEGSMDDLVMLMRMVMLGVYGCANEVPVKLELHMNAWAIGADEVTQA